MASSTESSLISKLKTSDSTEIFTLISDYLQPFSDIISSSSSSSSNQNTTLIRQLLKRFLPFINTSLSILPKRIPEIPNSNEILITELFKVYLLCLNCLESVSSQLDAKPSTFHLQRIRMIRCFESCSRFREAEVEVLKLLEKVYGVKKKKKTILPEIDKCGGDDDKGLFVVFVEIAVTLVRCASMASDKDDVYFRRVLHLMDEVKPWLRKLDSNSHEKFHKVLVYNLGKCALNFLEKTSFSDKDLVVTFCRTTLIEYEKSSIKDQFFKIAKRMCSVLFMLEEDRLLYIMDILDCVARESKVEEGNAGTDFVELVYYCVNNCKTANASICHTFAAYLNKTAEHYKQFMKPLNSILRLYAAGLLLVSCKLRSGAEDVVSSGNAKFECLLGTLLENKKILQSSPPLLGSLHICSRSSCISLSVEDRPFDGHTCTQSASDCEASRTYLTLYIKALEVLCLPLAKSVNSEWKQLITEKDDASATTMLSTVEDAFHALCQFILYSQSCTFETNGDGFGEKSRTLCIVTLAAFTLSIRTNLKLQKATPSGHYYKQKDASILCYYYK
ncbi:separase-like protein [Trifolium pratense]|uniref:Separase-like protein n=1 Tax=Trifolium pratense TaxID=57577 RepID=A0A2K3MNV4_TRIPR|nr:separase-like protein [Trifolium pratense]